MPPTIAIITRAKDEMPHARRAMEALRQQSTQDFDFLAVDSGSTDGTLEELEKAGAKIQRIAPEDYVPGKVLNTAIDQTRHDIIVLLNADAVPRSEHWLEKLVAPIAAGAADVTYSKQVARPGARFIVADDYARAYAPSRVRPDFFSAVACAFRRGLWEQIPFRETGYAEDAAWAKACATQGARIELVPESVVEHSHNFTLQGLYRKRHRQALANTAPPKAAQLIRACAKEILRDLWRATTRLRPHTIPYNLAYRLTILRATLHGARR